MDFENMYRNILMEQQKVYEKIDKASLLEFIQTIQKHNTIFLIGTGREGLAARAFAMRLMHMGKEVHWIWDDTAPAICPGDLLIAVMGDGKIGHIRYVCERAKEAGGFLYVVTGSPGSLLNRGLADRIFFLPGAVYRGTDDVVPSIQPMGNLFEQTLLVTFDMIVMLLAEKTEELTYEKMAARHRNVE